MDGQRFPKPRRSLHEESPSDSLFKLESELRKAYVLKSLETQVTEKKAQRMSEDIQDRISADLISVSNQALSVKKRHQEDERLQRISEHKHHLKEQILEKELKKRLQEEEEKLERQVLIEVDRLREEEEDQEKKLTKMHQTNKLMRQYQIHREMKEIIKDREDERELEEEKKNQMHVLDMEERRKKLEELKKDLVDRRLAMIETVARTLVDYESRKHEIQAVLADLAIQDIQQEAVIQALEDQLRRKKMTQELVSGLREQMVFEEECRRRFVEREKEFAESVMLRIMESERMERLTEESRRRKRARYREDLKSMMEDRTRMRDEELARIEESLKAERQRQEVLVERAREERMRLLTAHAGNVGEFINRGTLTREEEKTVEKMRKAKKLA